MGYGIHVSKSWASDSSVLQSLHLFRKRWWTVSKLESGIGWLICVLSWLIDSATDSHYVHYRQVGVLFCTTSPRHCQIFECKSFISHQGGSYRTDSDSQLRLFRIFDIAQVSWTTNITRKSAKIKQSEGLNGGVCIRHFDDGVNWMIEEEWQNHVSRVILNHLRIGR